MSDLKIALDIPAAAAACDVTDKTIRAAIHSGELRAKRQSRGKDGEGVGKYLISRRALEDWFENLPDG